MNAGETLADDTNIWTMEYEGRVTLQWWMDLFSCRHL